MVEAALISVITIAVMFAIFEFGRFFMLRQICTNAVREGARFASVHTNDRNTTQVQYQVIQACAGNPPTTFGMLVQLRQHGSLTNPFQISPNSNSSDIDVYRCNTAVPPIPMRRVAGVETFPANWWDADWTQAGFGDRIAVRLRATYRPLVPTSIGIPGLYTIPIIPDPINLNITTAIASEANG